MSATLSRPHYVVSEPNCVYTQASHWLPSHIESSPIAIRRGLFYGFSLDSSVYKCQFWVGLDQIQSPLNTKRQMENMGRGEIQSVNSPSDVTHINIMSCFRNAFCNTTCFKWPDTGGLPQKGPVMRSFDDPFALQWRHNGCDGVSYHWRLHCLLNCWFRLRSKKRQSSASLAFVRGKPLMTGEFPAQKASNAENVSIWWRHRGYLL